MAKREKKSLASLIGQQEIDPTAIENAVKKIHEKKEKPVAKPKVEKEKLIRVSVDTPQSLYLKLKEVALEEGVGSLRHLYLKCAREYLKSKGKI